MQVEAERSKNAGIVADWLCKTTQGVMCGDAAVDKACLMLLWSAKERLSRGSKSLLRTGRDEVENDSRCLASD